MFLLNLIPSKQVIGENLIFDQFFMLIFTLGGNNSSSVFENKSVAETTFDL